MPMSPAAAVASHACAHVGAVQVPIFSGFAAPAILQRLQDSEAKVLVCASHSYRRGNRVPMREIADEAVRDAPSVQHVVEWERDGGEWQVELGPGELPPLEVDSEHPYLLAYTSGTTGRPKGALHVHGGFLVSIAREVAYQTDVKAGRPRPLRDRHGLDHGPVDGRRRGRVRRGGRSIPKARRTGRTTASGRRSRRSA